MHDHLLDDIIQLEKSLQSQVDVEKQRIETWLEQERSQLEHAAQELGADPPDRFEKTLAEAREAAELEAAEHQERVERRCRRMNELPESWLTALLLRHLAGLLPEDGHDCPDGES